MNNPKLKTERVEDIEAFALKHGISAEDVQDLIDRVGNDLQALEDAVLVKQAEAPQP
ncbi:MAG: hypothetical protein M9955_21640 [Rhizobiaceae bacterium]|nr:hypothetical protein [Rhizobiaceae bacterium]